ncbi:glycosyltransferase family 4 protein [Methanothermobacter sp. KEPCO 2]|uniref:glycosyltransferase family 4 protein n=1 Tax=Methanothermobacter TaxID=145260 RepID=UPI0035196F80
MRIAFIYDGAYPWIKGGVEKRVYEIGRRLAERGHDVHWYCVGWWLDENDERDIEIDGIKYHGVCGPLDLYVNGRRSIKAALKFSISLLKPLLNEKFDLIDCQQFPYFSCFSAKIASLVNRSTLIITVIEYWGSYWYEYLGIKGFLGKIIEKATFRLTKNIITISKHVKDDVEINGINVLRVIPYGIDIGKIERVKPAELSSDVIFAGRIIEHKNIDVLIKAIHLLKDEFPDIKCLIIGEGPEKPRCKKMVEELDLQDNIKFLDFLNDENDLIAYMKSSRIFVLPSTREGLGIVVLEANAAGLPVVTIDTPTNAAKDLVKDGYDYLCPLSPKEIAASIKELIISDQGFKGSLRDYDWNKIINDLEKIYMDLITN